METVKHTDFTVEVRRDEDQRIQTLVIFDHQGRARGTLCYDALPEGPEGANRFISLYDFHKPRLPITFSAVAVDGEVVGLSPEQQDAVRRITAVVCLSQQYLHPPSEYTFPLYDSDGAISRDALFWGGSISAVRAYLASILGGYNSPKVIAMHASICKTTVDHLQFFYDHEDSR